MKKIPIVLVVLGMGIILFFGALRKESSSSAKLDLLKERYSVSGAMSSAMGSTSLITHPSSFSCSR